MDVLVNVTNQKIRLVTNVKSFVEGTQNFIRFVFALTDEWDGLTAFAQFSQNGNIYNQYLDEDKSCYLPAEIVAGKCSMMLYATGEETIATTNHLTFTIDPIGLNVDGDSTDISQSLYDQLVQKVEHLYDTITKYPTFPRLTQASINKSSGEVMAMYETNITNRITFEETLNGINITYGDGTKCVISVYDDGSEEEEEDYDIDDVITMINNLSDRVDTKADITALEAESTRALASEDGAYTAINQEIGRSQGIDEDLLERVAALEALDHDITDHIGDTTIHVTSSEKQHFTNDDIHVTLADKDNWDDKISDVVVGNELIMRKGGAS